MTDITVPARKPARPFFSSGPAPSRPFSLDKLATESLGRSHRAKIGKSRLGYCIDLMREILQLPETHRIGIVPGSDTGAFEMAMWTMLGARPSPRWPGNRLAKAGSRMWPSSSSWTPPSVRADYGQIPDLNAIDWSNDVLFTWNGTTSGVRVPNADFIPPTAKAWLSPTPPARCSLTTSTGRRSTSPPSRGRRCWAARAAMAC
jgi:phosphoserine aminotransferase